MIMIINGERAKMKLCFETEIAGYKISPVPNRRNLYSHLRVP